jgi:hypothetical protein
MKSNLTDEKIKKFYSQGPNEKWRYTETNKEKALFNEPEPEA